MPQLSPMKWLYFYIVFWFIFFLFSLIIWWCYVSEYFFE